jgi:hypothetical protein
MKHSSRSRKAQRYKQRGTGSGMHTDAIKERQDQKCTAHMHKEVHAFRTQRSMQL